MINRKLQNILRIVPLICVVFLVGCGPDNSTKIIEGEIYGRKFYYPWLYAVPPFYGISGESIYVRALHPTFEPLQISETELFHQKREQYLIRMLVKPALRDTPKRISLDELFQAMNERNYKATVFVGNEYGLVHMTQPPEGVADIHDIWLEKIDGKVVSYISCGEKILNTDVPQCRYLSTENYFRLEISFDKRMLPEWRAVRDNALRMINSFNSPETAMEFLHQSLTHE